MHRIIRLGWPVRGNVVLRPIGYFLARARYSRPDTYDCVKNGLGRVETF